MTASPLPTPPRVWDEVLGPGASRLEILGTVVTAMLAAGIGQRLPRRARERILGGFVGFQVGGAAWASETASAKGRSRAAGTSPLEPTAYAARQAYPYLVELVNGRRDWRRATAIWAGPVVAAAIVTAAPVRQRQRVAGVATGIVAATGAALAPSGWRWLPPVLALTVIHGHATADGPLARLLAPSRAAAASSETIPG